MRSLAHWTLPLGIRDLIVRARAHLCLERFSRADKRLVSSNQELQGTHRCQRCFVLATGPSLRAQNLTLLETEVCIGVSDCYRHRDYATARPRYYCIAPLHRPFTEADGMRRLEELARASSWPQTCFFGLSDKDVVDKAVFQGPEREIRYLRFQPRPTLGNGIDLTGTLASPISVAIMALWVAIYMGFTEIYLLGCDHNGLWKWDGASRENKLEHFYDGAPSIGYQPFDVDQSLKAHLKVREQYRWTKGVADAMGTRIFNATPGSYIDLFPRVDFESVVKR